MDKSKYGKMREHILSEVETPADFTARMSAQYEANNRKVRIPTDFELIHSMTTDTRPFFEQGLYENDHGLPSSLSPTIRQLGRDVDPLHEERLYMENLFQPVNAPKQLGEQYNDRMDNDPTDSSNSRQKSLFRNLYRPRGSQLAGL